MKIALINEVSQAGKNSIIYKALKTEADKAGHTVFNYGMYSGNNPNRITYVQTGLLASILITSGAADFIVTGCGTGQGAMMSLNAFPNMICGYIKTDLDAYLFSQVNAGNAISMAYAQDFGWGAEINLQYIFEKLFVQDFGGGYPEEKAEAEAISRKALEELKGIIHPDLMDILKALDKEFLQSMLDYPEFKEIFFANSKDEEISDYLKSVLDS